MSDFIDFMRSAGGKIKLYLIGPVLTVGFGVLIDGFAIMLSKYKRMVKLIIKVIIPVLV